MKKITSLLLLALIVVAISFCNQANNKTTYSGYQPFPEGYEYFEKNQELKQAVIQKNRAFIRDHGWKLWAGIMQQGTGIDWPVWFTWPTVTQMMRLNDTKSETSKSLIAISKENGPKTTGLNTIDDNPILDDIALPIYPLPQPVVDAYPNVITNNIIHHGNKTYNTGSIQSGAHIASDGDIMIVTESFSIEAFDWVTENKLYSKDTLEKKSSDYKNGTGPHSLNAKPKWISTKHMYWPVLKNELGVLPVWNNDFGPEYREYAGYEKWKTIVAIDPSNARAGQTEQVTYLHGVLDTDTTPLPPITADATIYNIDDFYYHQITQADWDALPDADKAAINASSYWAYNKPFGVGDYLVTIASHINTKEVITWALQSVWWSNLPDEGKYSKNRPDLKNAKGPWDHYLLTSAYGLRNASGKLDVSMNPYIELVIHPVATNCNNCHVRGGWPHGANLKADSASYQNLGCEDLLAAITPNDSCLSDHLLTDYIWVIPDRAK